MGTIPFLSAGAYEDQPYVYSRALELCAIREIEFEDAKRRDESRENAQEVSQFAGQNEPDLRGIATNPADRIRGTQSD